MKGNPARAYLVTFVFVPLMMLLPIVPMTNWYALLLTGAGILFITALDFIHDYRLVNWDGTLKKKSLDEEPLLPS